MVKFNTVKTDGDKFTYVSNRGILTSCSYDLFLISQAHDKGCDFEDLADGYGAGIGTHGDWSGIRDSSDKAIQLMLERALNYLF